MDKILIMTLKLLLSKQLNINFKFSEFYNKVEYIFKNNDNKMVMQKYESTYLPKYKRIHQKFKKSI